MQKESGVPRRYLLGVSSIAADECDETTAGEDDSGSTDRLDVTERD